MKRKKLLLSMFCGILCAMSPMTVFAQTVGTGETDVPISITRGSTFTVVLPESITDASSADSVNFTYSVSGSIASNTTVTVNVEDENDTTDGVQVKVTDKGNNEDYVDMLLPKTEFSSADVAAGTSVDGTTTIGNLTAGTWTGTAKFLVDTTGSGTDSGVTELSTGVTLYDASGNVVATLDGSQIDFTGTNASLAPSTILANYPSVTKIEIADGTTSIGANAFKDCSNLKYVGIPSSVTSIGDNAFSGCTGITGLVVPKSVVTIGDNAFSGIANVIYGGTATGSTWGATSVITDATLVGYNENDEFVVALNNAQANVEQDCEFNYSSSNPICTPTQAGKSLENYSSAKKVVITDNVTKIGYYAFAYCDGFTDITILDGVTTIGHNAFAYCDNLTDITIPNSVTTIDYGAFGACKSLTNVTIPDGVTTIGRDAFGACKSLTNVTIPDSVTTIGIDAFSYCTSLTNITIPDGVTWIGSNAFLNVPHITYNGAATGSPWGAKSIN